MLIALANHTLQPIGRMGLRLKSASPSAAVESVRLGPVVFEQPGAGTIQFTLPLEARDFVKVLAK